MTAYFAERLPWTRVRELADRSACALLPIGSTEAHGPHLPLNTDVVIALEVCRRVADRLERRSGVDTVIFPPVTYSVTDFAAAHAGTVSVQANTAAAMLEDVCVGIAGHRFLRVGVVNHHLEPAHFAVVHRAAAAASRRCPARVIVPDHRKKPFGPTLGDEFYAGGSHAGEYETALMLAASPDLVDTSVLATLSDNEVDLPARIRDGATNFTECGGPLAYFGTPRTATRARGEELYERLANFFADTLLAGWEQPPSGPR